MLPARASRPNDGWIENPGGALALLILTDQFPRHAFRGTAHIDYDKLATNFPAAVQLAAAVSHWL